MTINDLAGQRKLRKKCRRPFSRLKKISKAIHQGKKFQKGFREEKKICVPCFLCPHTQIINGRPLISLHQNSVLILITVSWKKDKGVGNFSTCWPQAMTWVNLRGELLLPVFTKCKSSVHPPPPSFNWGGWAQWTCISKVLIWVKFPIAHQRGVTPSVNKMPGIKCHFSLNCTGSLSLF